MKLIAGSSNEALAKKVAQSLHVDLSPVEVHVFPDGERRIRINEPIGGEHVFIVQSANTPVDTNYMELFFLIDAAKRSGAASVTAVVPYFGYQRQDHLFREGEAVSLDVIKTILEKMGANRLISVEMHSVKIPDIFTIPVKHLSALSLFAQQMRDEGWVEKETVLVTPDMGGVARIEKFSQLLDTMEYAVVEKKRDLGNGTISIASIEGNLTGKKRAILLDDMISSGKTIMLAAEKLQEKGVEEVMAFATHAVFSEDAAEKLQKSVLKKVFVTDTVSIPKDKQFEKLVTLSVAPTIAESIQTVL